MKGWRMSATSWAAAGFVVFGVAWVVVGLVSDGLDNWAPNLATEAFSIAATIAIVERIIRRENRRQVQPRVDRAVAVIANAYFMFARNASFDYASTHLSSDLSEIPTDPDAVLAFWQERHGTEDTPRTASKDGLPLLLADGVEFVNKVQRIVESDREHLPADLVIAIDNLTQMFGGHGSYFFDLVDEYRRERRPGLGEWLTLALVQSARSVGEALRRHPEARAVLDQLSGR
jgi:hypothetical protein